MDTKVLVVPNIITIKTDCRRKRTLDNTTDVFPRCSRDYSIFDFDLLLAFSIGIHLPYRVEFPINAQNFLRALIYRSGVMASN